MQLVISVSLETAKLDLNAIFQEFADAERRNVFGIEH